MYAGFVQPCVYLFSFGIRDQSINYFNQKVVRHLLFNERISMERRTQKLETADIKEMARQIRRDIIKMLFLSKGGHTGSPLDLADIFAVLYFDILRYDPADPRWEGRDYFFVSCGHVAPVWYATLARAGFFPISELATLRKLHTRLQGHPVPVWIDGVPGIEIASGSLGQGISVATGTALGLRLENKSNRVIMVGSDGELQEGSCWEGIMMAGFKKLDNLVALIDCNNVQIGGYIDKLLDINPLTEKFHAFGWDVHEIDGHNIDQVRTAIEKGFSMKGKPSVILARTVMGKGVPWMEGDAKWHGIAPNEEHAKKALVDLAPTKFGDFITLDWEKNTI
jgi:transketolase